MKTKISILSLILLLVFSGCQKKEKGTVIDYDRYLFDTSYVHEIDVAISEDDWNDLLENPTAKTKYSADVTIDGETLKNVSFSTKGNSSLYFPASEEGNERYPFKINFGKNVDGQTYHGLDKLSLSNVYGDTTFAKDYLSYELFRKIGVNAPLVSFAVLRINGNYHGLYAAIEDVDKSFLKRNSGGKGVLYKPEGKGLSLNAEVIEAIKNGEPVPTGESHGADLVYIDDQIESYPDIFENAETHAEDEDYLRVIEALKALRENRDLDRYLDTDEIIRYFAANVYLLNHDGYIGPMLHNYYLYENEGRLAMLPWDYSFSFATTQIVYSADDYNDQTNLINLGIDTPLLLTNEESRPMWSWIVCNEEYRNRYHETLETILDYFDSGEFEKEADRVHELLLPYVQADVNGLSTVEQFNNGYKALKEYCSARSESIRRQLNGSLAAVSSEQDPADRVDASDIKLLDMNLEQ